MAAGMKMKSKADITSLFVAAMMLLPPALSCAADSVRNRPIRLIVAFAPGGGSDTSARIIAQHLAELVRQPVVVDNRPGAAGNIATEIATRAQPDGHTLLWGFSTPIAINPSLYKNLPFDTTRDLQPITLIATSQYMLVVNPSVPANSVKELIAVAKSKPGQFSYASAGVGTPHHLAAEMLKKEAGLDIVQVTYKGGGPAAQAVVSGEVQIHFGSFASSLPFVKAHRLKALALTGPQRSREAPDLPTMQELGFSGYDVRSWFGVLAPAGTPNAIIAVFSRYLLEILAMPDVQQRLNRIELDVAEKNTPAEFAAYIKAEKVRWANVIRAAGIKLD